MPRRLLYGREPAPTGPVDPIFKEIAEMLVSNTGVAMTPEETAQMFRNRHGLVGEAKEFGVNDTHTREVLMDELSRILVKRPWPCYGDKVDIDRFVNEVHNAAREMGYTVVSEE